MESKNMEAVQDEKENPTSHLHALAQHKRPLPFFLVSSQGESRMPAKEPLFSAVVIILDSVSMLTLRRKNYRGSIEPCASTKQRALLLPFWPGGFCVKTPLSR
jgi:hypothetical protein